MKKLLSILMVMGIMFCFGACGEETGVYGTIAPKASPAEDFSCEFNDGTVTITGYHGADLEIVVPDTINERPVTKIGYEAFSGYDMKSIYIPKSVNYIANAFQKCYMLEEIYLPDGIKEEFELSYLEDTAWYAKQPFDEILYIGNVCLGIKATSISSQKSQTKIEIKHGTKTVLPCAFEGYTGVTEIVLPDSLQTIGYAAFERTNITEINLPSDLEYIGDSAFRGANQLMSVLIPENVTQIGKKAFFYLDIMSEQDLGLLNSGSKPRSGVKIYGKQGSEAERYANENNIEFISE